MNPFTWICVAMALLALLGLALCSPDAPGQYVIPAMRTAGLLCAGLAFAAALFHWGTP
ncbi:hypothetical protein [Streptomyces triculaminicus]|uniref:hypothetical protein n=1 Tax=Streptomyces triculaminicus TaxID=2816232 RepID=UPI0037A56DE5